MPKATSDGPSTAVQNHGISAVKSITNITIPNNDISPHHEPDHRCVALHVPRQPPHDHSMEGVEGRERSCQVMDDRYVGESSESEPCVSGIHQGKWKQNRKGW